MAINKIVHRGNTLIDLTDSTITTSNILRGAVGYNAKGERIVGSNTGGGEDLSAEINQYTAKLNSLQTAVTNLETAIQNKQ